jgi:hypothetical protein
MRKRVVDLYQGAIMFAGSFFAAANEAIPFYEDGDELPCVAKTAVTGKHLVQVTAGREGTIQTTYSPPPYVPDTGLDTTASGNRIQVGLPNASGAAGAGKRCLGVAAWDAGVGVEVTVLRGRVLPIVSSADITAGQEVEVAAGGTVIPLASGTAIGVAVDTSTNGNDAQILLYQ